MKQELKGRSFDLRFDIVDEGVPSPVPLPILSFFEA